MAKPKKKSKSTVNKAGNYTKPSMRKMPHYLIASKLRSTN